MRAWDALGQTAFGSVKQAFAFFGATAGVSALLGGGVAALNSFSLPWMVALSLVTLATWPLSFVVLELIRLHGSHRLLKEVLESERVYEVLLSDARRERDDIQSELHRQRLQLEIVRAAEGILEARGERRALAPPVEPRKEEADD